MRQEIRGKTDAFPSLVKAEGYPDVQTFLAAYNKAEAIVERYNWDLLQWKQDVDAKKAEKMTEKQSVREKLRQLKEEGKKKTSQKRNDHER